MWTYLVICIIKFVIIDLCIGYSFFRIIDYKYLTIMQKISFTVTVISLAVAQYLIQGYTSTILRILIIYFVYTLILARLTNINIGHSIIINVISISISYIVSFFSTTLVEIILYMFLDIKYTNPIHILLISLINILCIYCLFKIPRFKHGFPFIKNKVKNDYWDIFILVICTVIISTYFIFNFFIYSSFAYYIIDFIIFMIITLITIQKTIILYYKHRTLEKNSNDYKQELEETKSKLETALEEKQKLIKSNHEFYHRQEAIMKKLEDLGNNQSFSTNTEFSAEYGDILDRINQLSVEYYEKTYTIPKLIKTNIVEIDDMLSYFQSKCEKDGIEFILKVDCDIKVILNKFISQSQLETLLGDLINNAIIAVNHSHNSFKSIMVIFGIVENYYELCVYDSGIPFEIQTLLALGTKPASTHEIEGGTGIGFITTFETLNSTNASLIINELTNNNYTKSLEIKFDGKHEYTIISNRKEIIKQKNNLNRNIIIK